MLWMWLTKCLRSLWASNRISPMEYSLSVANLKKHISHIAYYFHDRKSAIVRSGIE